MIPEGELMHKPLTGHHLAARGGSERGGWRPAEARKSVVWRA